LFASHKLCRAKRNMFEPPARRDVAEALETPYLLQAEDGSLMAQKPRPSAFSWLLGRLSPRAAAFVVVSGLIATAGALTWLLGGRAAPEGPAVLAAAAEPPWHGVSLGGWLVMEINPSKRSPSSPMDLRPQWMYDQLEANSELDFVVKLRREHGDEFAIATMKNHWAGYITDRMLDAAAELGITAVRIPVGYWIVDKPVGGGSFYEYGISPEGFVTGGINHLQAMLVKLKSRGMSALLDIHAHPCNSACVSNGLYCAAPLAFGVLHGWPIPEGQGGSIDEVEIADLPRCASADPEGGAAYKTTRGRTNDEGTWGDVAVNSVEKLAQWASVLPEEAKCVIALQLANEPALGPDIPAVTTGINLFYERAIAVARMHLQSIPLVLSWINLDKAIWPFLKSMGEADRALNGGGLISDHHYYLNWQGWMLPTGQLMPWNEILRRACSLESENGWRVVDQYAEANQEIIIGEWSLATNMDAPIDLDDPAMIENLQKLFQHQIEAFGKLGVIRGHFFWTLRMGSGWDPRPTEDDPNGRQLEGTSAWTSAEGYPFKVWSLLEMAHLGVATRLDQAYTGCAELQADAVAAAES